MFSCAVYVNVAGLASGGKGGSVKSLARLWGAGPAAASTAGAASKLALGDLSNSMFTNKEAAFSKRRAMISGQLGQLQAPGGEGAGGRDKEAAAGQEGKRMEIETWRRYLGLFVFFCIDLYCLIIV